jgi:excisionase family DNA binding protein
MTPLNDPNALFGSWTMVCPAQSALPAPVSTPVPAAQSVQTSPKPSPVFYTIPEAAAVLNVCTKTVRRLIARRYLTCCNVLRKKLIPRSQIEAFLKATCDAPITRK